jgi:ribA/ribD-fused uncharacterized protein
MHRDGSHTLPSVGQSALRNDAQTGSQIRTASQDASITGFVGAYSVLSNFHPSRVEWMGFEVSTVEHAFQLAKTLNPQARSRIASAPAPRDAKRLGRCVELRPEWEQLKCGVMKALLVQKFTRHAQLAQILLGTADAELVEANTWGDTFWGVCGGVGRNQLGLQLMEVRMLLRSLEGTARSAS